MYMMCFFWGGLILFSVVGTYLPIALDNLWSTGALEYFGKMIHVKP